MAARGDEADLRAPLLQHGVGADGRTQRQPRGVAQQRLGGEAESLAGQPQRLHDALGEIVGRGRRLGGDDAALGIHHHAVGERAAGVDADEVAFAAVAHVGKDKVWLVRSAIALYLQCGARPANGTARRKPNSC